MRQEAKVEKGRDCGESSLKNIFMNKKLTYYCVVFFVRTYVTLFFSNPKRRTRGGGAVAWFGVLC